jgi:putative FmdB family regulatory protein|tara:strand:- start:1018 stop:1269 length:252 start_codon:yes stop_codon:yes gene_type:complete
MPNYDYYCSSCEHEFEINMKISERNVPTQEPCPECSERDVELQLATPTIGDPWRFAGKRPDEGFRDRLREIKKHHRGNTIDVR